MGVDEEPLSKSIRRSESRRDEKVLSEILRRLRRLRMTCEDGENLYTKQSEAASVRAWSFAGEGFYELGNVRPKFSTLSSTVISDILILSISV